MTATARWAATGPSVNSMTSYSDILHRARPISQRHAKMSLIDRAAQFSSFAALTGYEDVIEETGRLTDAFVQMDEGVVASIDRQLQALVARIQSSPVISVTYFLPDPHKKGGSYQTKTGSLKKIDSAFCRLQFSDRTEIPLESIIAITEI